ncbi:hypothetical protein LN042_19020 [Kitasatospora sp. RB6PN24]|uniref:hypothetical protein n=1 Tax=Kitasatospora humi TaxID=2893891 RepID=UPI001E2DCE95|nr:hypothetical protein [Kitasatospora humi]MCC9309149.1 hypothetical protein [Kitasatospora humi]
MDNAYEVATEVAAQAGWAGEVRVQSFGAFQARIVQDTGGWWIGLTSPRNPDSGTADLAAGRWEDGRPTDPLVRSGPLPYNFTELVLVAKTLVRHLATGSTPGAQVHTDSGGYQIDVLPEVRQLVAAVGLMKVTAAVVDPGTKAPPLVRLQVLPDPEPKGQEWDPAASVLTTVVASADSTADQARQLADVVALAGAESASDDSWISPALHRFPNAGALAQPTSSGCRVLITRARRRPDAGDFDPERDHLEVELRGEAPPQWAAAALFAWMYWDCARRRQAQVSGPLELALPPAGAIELVSPGGTRAKVSIGPARVIPC